MFTTTHRDSSESHIISCSLWRAWGDVMAVACIHTLSRLGLFTQHVVLWDSSTCQAQLPSVCCYHDDKFAPVMLGIFGSDGVDLSMTLFLVVLQSANDG